MLAIRRTDRETEIAPLVASGDRALVLEPSCHSPVMRARTLVVLAEAIGPVPAFGRCAGRRMAGAFGAVDAVAAYVPVLIGSARLRAGH